ncbi:MAG: hypothetical protein Homavirus50_2 [Homavirus sp.]|uniref:Uncharacterized protein n=1 Tax=Homavirus sp. TaxID=2487769 RepID=A0A3G5A586_9VIRU|nr:MAG: hypothetical protein Homavirus50_2 [Homavirus sp.]
MTSKGLSKLDKLKALGLDENQKGISNKVLNQLYLNIIHTKWHEQKVVITRREKLKAVGLDNNTTEEDISNEVLNQMYTKVISHKFLMV